MAIWFVELDKKFQEVEFEKINFFKFLDHITSSKNFSEISPNFDFSLHETEKSLQINLLEIFDVFHSFFQDLSMEEETYLQEFSKSTLLFLQCEKLYCLQYWPLFAYENFTINRIMASYLRIFATIVSFHKSCFPKKYKVSLNEPLKSSTSNHGSLLTLSKNHSVSNDEDARDILEIKSNELKNLQSFMIGALENVMLALRQKKDSMDPIKVFIKKFLHYIKNFLSRNSSYLKQECSNLYGELVEKGIWDHINRDNQRHITFVREKSGSFSSDIPMTNSNRSSRSGEGLEIDQGKQKLFEEIAVVADNYHRRTIQKTKRDKSVYSPKKNIEKRISIDLREPERNSIDMGPRMNHENDSIDLGSDFRIKDDNITTRLRQPLLYGNINGLNYNNLVDSQEISKNTIPELGSNKKIGTIVDENKFKYEKLSLKINQRLSEVLLELQDNYKNLEKVINEIDEEERLKKEDLEKKEEEEKKKTEDQYDRRPKISFNVSEDESFNAVPNRISKVETFEIETPKKSNTTILSVAENESNFSRNSNVSVKKDKMTLSIIDRLSRGHVNTSSSSQLNSYQTLRSPIKERISKAEKPGLNKITSQKSENTVAKMNIIVSDLIKIDSNTQFKEELVYKKCFEKNFVPRDDELFDFEDEWLIPYNSESEEERLKKENVSRKRESTLLIQEYIFDERNKAKDSTAVAKFRQEKFLKTLRRINNDEKMRKKNVYFDKNKPSVCLFSQTVTKELEQKNKNQSNKPWGAIQDFLKKNQVERALTDSLAAKDKFSDVFGKKAKLSSSINNFSFMYNGIVR